MCADVYMSSCRPPKGTSYVAAAWRTGAGRQWTAHLWRPEGARQPGLHPMSATEKNTDVIESLQKFVPGVPIDIISTLVQVMAWYQTGGKPFPEPMFTIMHNAISWRH